jgi:colanic acid/amylovoran biosynthesis glycosyltransferase
VRICRVIKYVPPIVGGMEFHSEYLSEQQAKDGDEVELFYLRGDLKPPHPRVTVRRVPLAGPIGLLSKDMLVSLAFAIIVFPMVWWANRRRPFDVVHLHGDVFEALSGVLFWKVLSIPSVITVHAGLNTKRVYRLLAGPVFRRIPWIIAHSREIGDELASLKVDSDKVSFSSSGIWVTRFQPLSLAEKATERAKYGLSENEKVVMSVGRLHSMKGHEFLIEAVRILGDDFDGRLVFIGDGPEKDCIIARAAALGDKVLLLGEHGHDAVPRLLALADIYVLASITLARQRESTPTAIKEAMAASLPLIVTPVGGIKDHIADGINGIIVPERDAGALAEALRKLIADPPLRAEMGARNREQAVEYDWSRVAGIVKQTYISAGAGG